MSAAANRTKLSKVAIKKLNYITYEMGEHGNATFGIKRLSQHPDKPEFVIQI